MTAFNVGSDLINHLIRDTHDASNDNLVAIVVDPSVEVDGLSIIV